FSTPVNLCKEYLHAKHQEELDQYNRCCQDCAFPSTPIHEPVNTSTSTSELESKTLPPLEPDSTLLVVEQLKQQVETQNQLILQLQQK
ncbi:18705_t:CDS:1, partial [Dentiscutata erythropus]